MQVKSGIDVIYLRYPTYFASALVNNDFSGLDDEESKEVLGIIEECKPFDFIDAQESYTGIYNDTLCDVTEYILHRSY